MGSGVLVVVGVSEMVVLAAVGRRTERGCITDRSTVRHSNQRSKIKRGENKPWSPNVAGTTPNE